MATRSKSIYLTVCGWLVFGALLALVACSRPAPTPTPMLTPSQLATPALHTLPHFTRPGDPTATLIVPTPDATRAPEALGTELYLVQRGDTLGRIALQYDTTIEDLIARNTIADPDNLQVGQALLVPILVERVGPAFKIVPDSELVYGPAYTHFDVAEFIASQGGYLKSYTEDVDGQALSGAQIVELVAQRYSVGPRVLLALVEYKAGWVTRAALNAQSIAYPAGYVSAGQEGLLKQLSCAADYLNDGYYGWQERGYTTVRFGDGTRARIAPGLNAGTIGIQEALALASDYDAWQNAAGPQGMYATFVSLFGDPFAYAIEPLLPPTLAQPDMRLPWGKGETWYYTGGPHGGWGSGSAWAGLDFTPPGEQLGCYDSSDWVTSASGGTVTRSGNGVVVVDLDNDGFEQTGWTLLYLHIGTDGRVAAGSPLAPGDRIGRPSCEGGFSNGTHVHIARRYNGQWITADGPIPFVLSGWRPMGTLTEYDGTLTRDNVVLEACECREAKNGLIADPQ